MNHLSPRDCPGFTDGATRSRRIRAVPELENNDPFKQTMNGFVVI